MKKNEFTYPSADNKTTIYATEWIPDGEVRAVLQIAHGMVEYIDRYDGFASFLADHGFYVTGNDHLGHGRSVTSDDEHGYFAHPNGNECVIKDMDRLRLITTEKYPGIPYFFSPGDTARQMVLSVRLSSATPGSFGGSTSAT